MKDVTKYLEESFADGRNWRGVNEFVKDGMCSLLDLVRLSFNSLRDLEREVVSKASKNEIAVLTSSKLAISDFPLLYERYSSQRTFQNTINRIECEVKGRMSQVLALIEVERKQRLSNDDLFSQIASRFQSIEQTLQHQKSQNQQNMLKKADRSELTHFCKLNQLFEAELEQLATSLSDISSSTNGKFQQCLQRLQRLEQYLEQESQTQGEQKVRWQASMKMFRHELQEKMQIYKIESKRIQEKLKKPILTQIPSNEMEQITQRHSSVAKTLESLNQRLDSLETRQGNFNKFKADCSKQLLRLNQLSEQIQQLSARKTKAEREKESVDAAAKALQAIAETLDQEMDKKIQKTKGILQNRINVIESRYITKSEVLELVDSKLDIQQYENDARCNNNEQLCKEMQQIHQRYNEICKKLDLLRQEIRTFQISQSKLNTSVAQALNQCLLIQEFQKKSASFASLHDLKIVVCELTKKMDTMVQREKFVKWSESQSRLNETLCSENILARWMWMGDGLKNGNLVPWQKQIINTLPQNFIWEQKTAILTVISKGLYMLEMGFYSKKKPTVQLIVNGITILSAVNSNSYVVHHSSGKLKDIKQKQHDSISGLTMVDYLLLPAKARLAISYVGEEGQGFLSLKRM